MDAAKLPDGDPKARLDKWMKDFDGKRYENVDAETREDIKNLRAVYDNAKVQGIWVQVEAPALNSANLSPLNVTLHAWGN